MNLDDYKRIPRKLFRELGGLSNPDLLICCQGAEAKLTYWQRRVLTTGQ